MSKEEKERLHLLFKVTQQEIFASGGDGDGTIVFRETKIEDVAREFALWIKDRPGYLCYHRYDINSNHVLFSDGSNENITFMNAEEAAKMLEPSWKPEIKMEVW